MKNCDNPSFQPQAFYVIYDPETDAYMTCRVRVGSGHCAYWAKDVRRALHYWDKSHAVNALNALKHEGHSKVEVRTLDD